MTFLLLILNSCGFNKPAPVGLEAVEIDSLFENNQIKQVSYYIGESTTKFKTRKIRYYPNGKMQNLVQYYGSSPQKEYHLEFYDDGTFMQSFMMIGSKINGPLTLFQNDTMKMLMVYENGSPNNSFRLNHNFVHAMSRDLNRQSVKMYLWYPNGNVEVLSEGANGMHQEWYEDGTLKIQGQYLKGKKSGKWVTYDSIGTLSKTEIFKDGNLLK